MLIECYVTLAEQMKKIHASFSKRTEMAGIRVNKMRETILQQLPQVLLLLHSKWRAAATGCGGIRVIYQKARAFKALGIIYLAAD